MATGKTTITDLLSSKISVPVFRKDDIYDTLSQYGFEHRVLNDISVKILQKLIDTNASLGGSFILDIGMGHKPYAEDFFNSIARKDINIVRFLCVCSNSNLWEERIQQRIVNPTPNQRIRSVDEARQHYADIDITPFEDETVIDSSGSLDKNLDTIMKKINYT